MQFKPKPNCPLNGFKPCAELECGWFTCIRGKNPQSDQEIDEYGCAIAWLPVLLVENAQMQRQTGAAVETFRNEMATPGNNMIAVLTAAVKNMQQAIVEQNANIIPALLNVAAGKRIGMQSPRVIMDATGGIE